MAYSPSYIQLQHIGEYRIRHFTQPSSILKLVWTINYKYMNYSFYLGILQIFMFLALHYHNETLENILDLILM